MAVFGPLLGSMCLEMFTGGWDTLAVAASEARVGELLEDV
jgi:hypothetical protein